MFVLLPNLAVIALAVSSPARFALTWQVPCAPAPDVIELVGQAEGSAAVEVAPRGDNWRLAVRFLSPQAAERVMVTQTCEQAAQAALLVVRLAAGGAPAPPRTPVTSPQVEKPALVVAPAPPEPPQRSLALAALAQQGPLPTFVSRLGVAAGLEWDERWLGLLSLRLGLQTVVPGGPTADARVLVQPILGAQLSGCWQPRAGRFSGGPCATVGAEAWVVRAENVARPREATAFFVTAGLDARGAVQLWEGLGVTAALGGRLALVRPSVSFQDSGTLFQSSLFCAEGEVGLRWAW